MKHVNTIKFIDLFAGMGGFRLGFERACKTLEVNSKCVFTSEIKPHACQVYMENFPDSTITGDITQVETRDIPDFDVLLGGFPCQAFSSAGKRHGFLDTRGTLFFEIERILREKQPQAFILENVDGLVNHDSVSRGDEIGRTLSVILDKLNELGYKVTWRVLNAVDFDLAQSRKRIFIVGTRKNSIGLYGFKASHKKLINILESNQVCLNTRFSNLLLSHFSAQELRGKCIKDKRGGKNNIHSWDIELKGETSVDQKELMSQLLKARRNKKWGKVKGIQWMDGMPLTISEIQTFYQHPKLSEMLDDLVTKKYLKYEHPKDIVELNVDGKLKRVRQERTDIEKGYNIVAGKLSYEISKILDPEDVAPTLVATDLDRVAVVDGTGVRRITKKELCRLFGFPDDFKLNLKDSLAHDLFGNTVAVNVVEKIAERLVRQEFQGEDATSSRSHEVHLLPSQMALAL